AERIQAIVRALRTFSRMDEAEVKTVNIHDGIDSTLMILQSRLKPTAGHRGIDIIRDYGNLPLIECYAGQLNQVFMNVLSNAIDALEDAMAQGKWDAETHSTPQIHVCTEQVGDRVVIRIRDNGPGMRESVRKRLFEPFFTTKAVGKGTGLGLSISYQVVVDRHGGQLTCTSAPGEGAEFVIRLPLGRRRGL
ncbi:HAMP domain-containing histidine kinase, partial [Leptolyngbya sp. FACHB-36]|uniref:sensor histidine kinase n=1 Tax=Leptolyngbya sp. FACHB-36 TaxID=2692808 RepID=UPI001680F6F0